MKSYFKFWLSCSLEWLEAICKILLTFFLLPNSCESVQSIFDVSFQVSLVNHPTFVLVWLLTPVKAKWNENLSKSQQKSCFKQKENKILTNYRSSSTSSGEFSEFHMTDSFGLDFRMKKKSFGSWVRSGGLAELASRPINLKTQLQHLLRERQLPISWWPPR